MVWNVKTEQTGNPFSRPEGYYEAEAKKRVDKILQEAKAKKEEQLIGWNSIGLS